MSILSLPVLSRRNATTASLSLLSNTQTFESPLNKTVQTYELPGAKWQFSATWENLLDADYFKLKAFILKCRGMAGRFYAGDLTHKNPLGRVNRGGTVSGAGQYGRVLNARWTPAALTIDNSFLTADMDSLTCDAEHEEFSDWFLPGDYINVNGELKMVVDQSNIPASGAVTLLFEPALRGVPVDGSSVVVSYPQAVFRLDSDNIDKASKRDGFWSPVTITGIEVFQ